ncbi:MAG: ParB N-terminal domain-containing protein [Candidatus Accumulibacter necessarius]|jgi:hypothetical protein
MIDLSKLRLDPARGARVELNQDTVNEYSDAMRAGAQFPPVIVFCDDDEFWLADGFHRVHAARLAGRDEICEERRPGTRRDAILFSLSANARHGLRRSNADKRRAVQTLLDDPEWSKWSSNEIAKRCAVSHTFVDELRRPYLAEMQDSLPESRTVTRNGTTYEQKKKAGAMKVVDTRDIHSATDQFIDLVATRSRMRSEQPDEPLADSGPLEDSEWIPKPPRQAADGVWFPAPRSTQPKLLSEAESARIMAENAHLQAENTELQQRIETMLVQVASLRSQLAGLIERGQR